MNMLAKTEAASPVPLRFGVADFMRLANEGMFEDYARAELIEGEIFVVNAQYRPHGWARRQLARAFDTVLSNRADGLTAVEELSIDLSPDSMPEPDITLTTEPVGDGPIPRESVKLVVEISDTTLTTDLGRKVALYASHAIAEYWVVDLEGQVVHQMWGAAEGGYRERRLIEFGTSIVPATLMDITVVTDRLS